MLKVVEKCDFCTFSNIKFFGQVLFFHSPFCYLPREGGSVPRPWHLIGVELSCDLSKVLVRRPWCLDVVHSRNMDNWWTECKTNTKLKLKSSSMNYIQVNTPKTKECWVQFPRHMQRSNEKCLSRGACLRSCITSMRTGEKTSYSLDWNRLTMIIVLQKLLIFLFSIFIDFYTPNFISEHWTWRWWGEVV